MNLTESDKANVIEYVDSDLMDLAVLYVRRKLHLAYEEALSVVDDIMLAANAR